MRHTEPIAPVIGGAVCVDVPTDTEKRLILIVRRVVDMKDNQVSCAIIVEICDCDAGALIFPRKPVGHIDPGSPPAGHVAQGIQFAPDAILPAIHARRIVDHEHEQIAATLRIGFTQRNRRILVLKRKPVGHIDPRCPATRHIASGIQLAANAEQAAIFVGLAVNHEDHQILLTILIKIGDRDARTLVLCGKPIRHIDPRRPAASDRTLSG